jgi:hypothetical protein
MKKCTVILLFASIASCLWAQYGNTSSSYDVEALYSFQDVSNGTIAITNLGQTVEIKKLLVPMRINVGTYSVQIKRVDSNLYEVIGKQIYIKTKYCYEYTYGNDAILEITSSYGYTIGKLYFKK